MPGHNKVYITLFYIFSTKRAISSIKSSPEETATVRTSVKKNYKNYSVLGHMDLITRYDEAGIYPFEKIKPIIEEILKIVIAKPEIYNIIDIFATFFNGIFFI